MDDLQDKLGAILSNPQMMQQIMSMAQAFGMGAQTQAPPPTPLPAAMPATAPDMPDAAMLQNIYAIAQQSGIDPHQKALLKALEPYLTMQRIAKLERAMRAAKLTSLATGLLGSSGRTLSSGR